MDIDVIPLEGFYEGFGHAVELLQTLIPAISSVLSSVTLQQSLAWQVSAVRRVMPDNAADNCGWAICRRWSVARLSER